MAQIFNAKASALMSIVEKKSHDEIEIAHIGRLKKRINLIKSTLGPDILLVTAAPIMVIYSDYIIKENQDERDDFFLRMDMRAEYYKLLSQGHPLPPIDDTIEQIFSLIDSVKSKYLGLTRAEKNIVYSHVLVMLDCCVKQLQQ